MAEARRHVQIASSALRRLHKEMVMYAAEAAKQRARLDAMPLGDGTTNSAEEVARRQPTRVLNESVRRADCSG
jgi:hypothetical protein